MTVVVQSPDSVESGDGALQIALVNNMPDSALIQTEDQFTSLLVAGSAGLDVVVRRYTLPEVPRAAAAAQRIAEHYFPIGHLYASPPTAMIISGSDPREPELTDEPYWAELAELIDWAATHTANTMVSCLSAHALLFTADGLRRRKLPHKCSGVYEQTVAPDHPLTRGLPAHIRIPHSRHNDVPLPDLAAHGYAPLISSAEVGWTVAYKQIDSCGFLLMQGHPEYDAITLLLEYRRDTRRFLLGERPAYPPTPSGYLTESAEAAMNRFRDDTLAAPESMADRVAMFPFDVAVDGLTFPWREPAERIYTNWLSEIARTVSKPEVADAR